VTFVLTAVVFLTQSIRFLELVVDSGASSLTFWLLTALALPKSFEIIIPLAAMTSVLFVMNRMSVDSELVAIRSVGLSPFQIGRPALYLALVFTVLLYSISMFLAPMAQANMNKMRQVVKSQFSSMLFREGVFNRFGNGVTVYVRHKDSEGGMAGLVIHDARDGQAPATIIAKSGIVINTDDAFQVVVYEGSRQSFDPVKGVLQRLNFERYIIDLPDSDPIRLRWAEPDERTIIQLFQPDGADEKDLESLREFQVEINRRLTEPLQTLVFTMIALCAMLLGPQDRRGQAKRILLAIALVVIIKALFMAGNNLAQRNDAGLILMYALIILPLGFSTFLLSGAGETMRRKWLYKGQGARVQ